MNITPRLFNVILISLVLGLLCWVSVRQNTAQETETPAAVVEDGSQQMAADEGTAVSEPPAVSAPAVSAGTEGGSETVPQEKTDEFPLQPAQEEAIKVAAPLNVTFDKAAKKVTWGAPADSIGIKEYMAEITSKEIVSGETANTEVYTKITNTKSVPVSADTAELEATLDNLLNGIKLEEGEYYFRVQAVTDLMGYTDSDWSVAGEKLEIKPEANYQGLITLSVFIVLILGCYFLGNVIAKRSRLPEHGFKIFVVLLSFFAGFAALALGWNRLTLGIDLQGGVVLIYDVKPIGGDESASQGVDMDELTRAISRRVNPGGVREIAITKLGAGRVQVVIPNAEAAEVARIERVISESGALTFRILASRAYPADEQIIQKGEAPEAGRDILDSSGRVIARWVPVFDSERESFRNPHPSSPIYHSVRRERGQRLEVLVKYDDDANIPGEYLTSVDKGVGQDGSPGVAFNFNSVGANKCSRLTGSNLPDKVQPDTFSRSMGIILNDSLYSAPRIKSRIQGNGIIEFSAQHTEEGRKRLAQDIRDLISVLQAGALPAELSKEPVGKMQIGATLGNDTIQKAKYALAFSAFIVVLFMIFYYRLAGIIASFCVVTNTVLIVAIMLSLRAAFTLPGLAGLVLTIGMAVDANILIFERIREELRGGASLKMAIRNGYGKAFSAIFDSNITTIFAGVILYIVGTEQVKGFAVTLTLGIALNMFTAIFCARVIMEVLAAQRWVKTFNMMQFFRRPNINFLGARMFCMTLSLLIIVAGLAGVAARGPGLLDIDFVGGVSVEAVFKHSQKVADVRANLDAKDATIKGEENRLNDRSVQNVQAAVDDEGRQLEADTRFIITTSTPQVKVDGKEISTDVYRRTVENILKETFGKDLDYCRLEYEIAATRKVADYDETTVKITKRYPKTNHDALASEIQAIVKKAVEGKIIDGEFSAPDITRPGYMEGGQQSFEDWEVTFRAPKEDLEKVLELWKAELDDTPNFPTSTEVGGSVARHTRIQGAAAIIASLIFMAIYISGRFSRWQYGLVAVVGLIHVVLVVLGLIALSRWCATEVLMIDEFRIGLPVVAAFLTLIAYTINDTIILFDRIRENLGKSTVLTGSMINMAINQTLSRTVLTSLTTFMVAVILYIFGGQGIHAFAFTMTAGVVCGTYSTIFICAPLLFWVVGKDDLKPGEIMTMEK